MEPQEGVLMDVSYASSESFRGIVEFANNRQGLLWSSPPGRDEDEDEEENGGGLAGQKKLVVVAPRIVEGLNAAIAQNGWTSSF